MRPYERLNCISGEVNGADRNNNGRSANRPAIERMYKENDRNLSMCLFGLFIRRTAHHTGMSTDTDMTSGTTGV